MSVSNSGLALLGAVLLTAPIVAAKVIVGCGKEAYARKGFAIQQNIIGIFL